jgi:hypothetical protein
MPNKELLDTDISSLFEGCSFENSDTVNQIISKFSNANNLNYIFKNSDIKDGSGIVFPSQRFTLKGGFMGSKLVSDVDLPLNVVDISECFKDCKDMTDVKSQWNKDFTYSIVYDKCYYNCTNINRIDNRSGSIKEIPCEWGGFGFDTDNTGIYVVDILEDNYTIELGDIILDGTVDWGDSSFSEGTPSHMYKQAGTYTIEGKIHPNEAGLKPKDTLSQVLLSVNRLPKDSLNFENKFADCRVLRSVNLSQTDTSKITNTSNMFLNCSNMVTAPRFDFSSVEDMSNMYNGCYGLTKLEFKNLSKTGLIYDGVVNGCSKLANLIFTGKTQKDSAKGIINEFNNFITSNSIDIVSLEEKTKVQEEELITSLLASTDMFEMILSLLGQNAIALTKENKEANRIIDIYTSLITRGKKTLEEVPNIIREAVKNKLRG